MLDSFKLFRANDRSVSEKRKTNIGFLYDKTHRKLVILLCQILLGVNIFAMQMYCW